MATGPRAFSSWLSPSLSRDPGRINLHVRREVSEDAESLFTHELFCSEEYHIITVNLKLKRRLDL